MTFFKLGIYSGTICFILWLIFWLWIGNKWFSKIKRWLESSYRRSVVVIITVVSGYFGLIARVLDMINALIAVLTLGFLLTVYYTIVVSKNKTLRRWV
jgi:hypothetical protein